MNPLILLPLLVAGCVAAPSASFALHGAAVPYGAALPYAVQHEVTAHVPAGVELKQVGEVLPVAYAPVAHAVPGYAVQGELRQVTQEFPEPPAVAVDVNALPVLGAVAPYAAYPAVAAAVVKTVEAPTVVAHAVSPALAYSGVNVNIPAPVPSGEAPPPEVLVQRIPVKALGRPVVSYTPQITEVRPELNIIERTYEVAVPKPVYETKEVTPIHHQYVPEPYAVPHPYPVAQPFAVPTPVDVPVPVAHPVHVQHNVYAQPAVGYNTVAAAPAVHYAGAPAVHYAGAPAVHYAGAPALHHTFGAYPAAAVVQA